MSTIGSYPTRTFKESQKFLVLDPDTQSTSLVLGRDLVEYITPQSTYVFAEQSRAVAQNEDYQIGALIQTAGDLAAGDNFAGTFLVVPGGDGDFPMANGNDLLIIKGDVLLREQLASNTPAQGSSLIAHTGTSDTVTEALDKRTIYVGSVAELEALPSPESGQEALVGGCPFQYNGASWVPTAHVTPEIYGADGVDDSVAFNAISADAAAHEILCNGSYVATQDIIFNRSVKIHGSGNITLTGARLRFEGSLTDIGSISVSTANEGDRAINVTGLTGVSSGDLIIVHNQTDFSFSPHRANYQDGEFAEVLSVSGDVITLTAPLESTYAAALTNKVFKVNAVVPDIGGVSVKGDTGYVVEVRHARGGVMGARRIEGGTSGALMINKCYLTSIRGREYHCVAADTGLQYGVIVTNSQDVCGYGFSAHGTRHGIATGGDALDGAVPCRRVKFYNCRVSNDQPDLHCTDFHGNTKDSGYYNCDSLGDILMGGVNVEYVGGSVRKAATSAPFIGGEVNGGYVRYKGINLKFDASSSVGTVLYRFGNSAESALIENDVSVEIENIEVGENTLLTALLNAFVNFPATTKSYWSLKNIRLKSPLTDIQRVVIATLSGTGRRPESIVVRDIDTPRGYVQQWMSISGSFVGTRVTLPDSHFKGSFTIAAGTSASPAQPFTYPAYPSIPALQMAATGATGDATGGYVQTAQGDNQTASSAVIRAVTSTGNTATADMTTNIIATAKMEDYVL